jgi:hypothetical protein
MISYIFKKLPDFLIINILDYLSQYGVYYLTYNFKNNKFEQKINQNFDLLNKVNLFKFNNYPVIEFEDMNLIKYINSKEFESRNSIYNLFLSLTFKYPIKLSFNKVTEEDYNLPEKDEYLLVTNCYEIDYLTNKTKICEIILPNYFYEIIEEQTLIYKNKFIKSSNSIRLKNMWNGFKNYNYSKDLIFI